MININKRVSGITTMTSFRIYRAVNNKNIEYLEDICILLDIYVIADPRKKTLFVIFDFHLCHPVNIKLG
ncbi:hypothetical protein [Candidatus Hodarchaeum mangrovi]